MAKTIDHIERVMALVEALEERGLQPVLVGGIALAILGSQRVTKDFDFLISQSSEMENVADIFYGRGFELVSKFNNQGEVLRTIDNKKVAALRLKLDCPPSAFFFDPKTRLKIDLLFDFPLLAKDVVTRANKIKVKSSSLRIASREDLLRMKEIAYAARHSAADAQDLEFLKGLK